MEPAGIKWAAAGIKWEAAGEINLAPTELQLSKFLMLPAMGKAKAGINPRTPRLGQSGDKSPHSKVGPKRG